MKRKFTSAMIVWTVLPFLMLASRVTPAKGKTLAQQEVESIVDQKLADQKKKETDLFKKFNIQPVFKTWVNYSLDLDTSAHQRRTQTKWDNSFDLTRMYFGFTADLGDHVGVKWVLDANTRLTTAAAIGDTDFDIFLKTGFVEFKDFDWASGLKFVFGLQDMPWIGYVEDVWGWRVEGQVLTDYERYLNSTDLGVGVKYAFPSEFGDLHFTLVNGNGFNAGPENDNYKDSNLRVTLRPLANKDYFLSVLGVYGFNGSKSNDHYRAATLIGYKKKDHATIAGEFLYAVDPFGNLAARHPSLAALGRNAKGLGGSLFGELRFFWAESNWNKVSFVGRFDYLDPDMSAANNFHYRGISGMGYTVNSNFKFLLNHEFSSYSSGAGQRGNNTILLGMEAKL